MPEAIDRFASRASTLEPHITVRAGPSRGADRPAPTDERVRRLVELAHRECFVANSLRTEIVVIATIVFTKGDPSRASDL
jgi:organic hydroperoxide reductase OsmC/OhrA